MSWMEVASTSTRCKQHARRPIEMPRDLGMVGLVHRWSSPGVVHVTHTTYTTHHVHHGGHWAARPDPNSIELPDLIQSGCHGCPIW